MLTKILNFLDNHKNLKHNYFFSGTGGHYLMFSIITHYLSLQLKRVPTKFYNGIEYISSE